MPKQRKKKVIVQRGKSRTLKKTSKRPSFFFVVLFSLIGILIIVFSIKDKISYGNHSSNSSIAKKNIAYADEPMHIPILLYHYVEDIKDYNDTIRISLNIPPSIFEEQVKSLQTAGFTFITMREVAEISRGDLVKPEKAVVLTFDDGYEDFYDVVFPLLKKHHVKAVAYIAPGLLDTPNYMTREQVLAIYNSGLVEIAGHTVNHIYLQNTQLATVYYEVNESKRLLEGLIKVPVVSFAYPYGAYDRQVEEVVEQAGYTTAVSTISDSLITKGHLFAVGRIRPGVKVGKELTDYIQQTSF